MAEANYTLSEDQLLCSICLSVFEDPVSLPCGHNFCQNCISSYWDKSTSCACPLCKEEFDTRPQLRTNTLLSSMASQFGKSVPLSEESKKRRAGGKKTMEERKREAENIRTCLDLSQEAADKETADGVEVFTALGLSVQKNLEELKEGIQEKNDEKAKLGKALLTELEEEISELEKRGTEMEKPTDSQDPLHFPQTSTALTSEPSRSNRTGVSICQASFEGAVVRSLLKLEKTFTEVLDKTYRADLKTRQMCAVNVTFDPDTAHPTLAVSRDKKQVHSLEVRKNVPDNPKRFSDMPAVLGQQCFSKGRFYYEVQVTGKTQWVLGVTRESINRKRKELLPGIWLIYFNDGKLCAVEDASVKINLRRNLQKIGVFVDYEEEVVSFHDVETAAPLYFFTDCCFKETLFPFFIPWHTDKGRNISPMTITYVSLCTS